MNSRRFMSDMAAPQEGQWGGPVWSVYRSLSLPQSGGQVLGVELNRSESRGRLRLGSMSALGHSRRSGGQQGFAECPLCLQWRPNLRVATNRRDVPCVDGSELTRTFFTFAALVGAAMCSAFRCGSHGRWP